jgi:peptidoglycan/xylan/chitin deacetylase (PgdA/CDA1 family)
MLAFARPITAPGPAPAPDGQQRTAAVPILMYHYISDPPPSSDRYRWALSVTPANLDAQMSYLKQAGYHAITLYQLYDYLAQGQPLPKPISDVRRRLCGRLYARGVRILQKHRFVGTFFIR